MATKKKADSRSVHTDALATLGTIIDDTAKRDAIHLAVLPCTAITTVFPGQHVNELGNPTPVPTSPLVGIVDPFLTGPVYQGQKFWLIIYPRVITSLRHVWTHPSFPDEATSTPPLHLPPMPAVPKKISVEEESEAYIRRLADSVGLSYGRLLSAAENYIKHDSWVTGGAEMEGESVPDEFWNHYEVVTGEEVPEDKRGSFFSCSC